MIFISVADNRKPPSQTVPTAAERAALFDAIIAYGGTYKVDGSKVLIHIDTHTVPPFPETVDRTYTMEINGNKLTLTADPFVEGPPGSGLSQSARLNAPNSTPPWSGRAGWLGLQSRVDLASRSVRHLPLRCCNGTAPNPISQPVPNSGVISLRLLSDPTFCRKHPGPYG